MKLERIKPNTYKYTRIKYKPMKLPKISLFEGRSITYFKQAGSTCVPRAGTDWDKNPFNQLENLETQMKSLLCHFNSWLST